MDCIFCRKGTSFKTVEHIIPESLGNVDHVLPKGVVCDACNNYFAVKVEKPLLEMPYFINLRQRNVIRSKKRRLVPDKVLFPHPKGGWVDAWIDEQGFILRSEDTGVIELLKEGKIKSMMIPTVPEVTYSNPVVSRFLAKTALEMVAYYTFGEGPYTDDFIDQNNLHPLREYARYGIGSFWPYHQRRIYSEDDRFMNTDIQPTPYEILHEFDFLMTDLEHIYSVMVIMGVEYVIKLNSPEINSYQQWLVGNGGGHRYAGGKNTWFQRQTKKNNSIKKGNMSEPKHHHYVPRFYLRRFVNLDGKLWIYDKSTNKQFSTTPEHIAGENQFYWNQELQKLGHDPLTLEK